MGVPGKGVTKTPAKTKAAKPADMTPVVSKRRPRDEDLDAILSSLSEGNSLRKTCLALGLHLQSTSTWLHADPARRGQYVRAQEMQGDACVDQIKDIVEKVARGAMKPESARVAIDAWKWIAGRMAPKAQPPQRVDVHHYDNLSDAEIERQLAAYRNGEIPDDERDGGEAALH